MNKIFRKLFPSKEMRRYRKMHRKHRKELIKLAKETHEYDWCWLHESVIMQIKHMHEYYSCGDNVWQTDDTRLPIIEELQYVLDLEKEIDRLSDDYSLEACNKSKELYEELYRSIGKNLENWWD